MSVDDSIALHEDQISSDRKSYSRQLMRTGNLPRQPVKASSDRKPWLPENRKSLIVDVGCGWGTLLLELRQLGFSNLMGVEGDADLARGTRERCGNNTDGISIVHDDAIEFFEQTDLNFERVLLFHVLEHFSSKDGRRLLGAIREHLTDGGRVVVEVPNMSSITGTNMQCSDLTHATAFTEYSLKQLLDTAGFEKVSVLCMPPPLRWWRIASQGSGMLWHLNHRLHSILYRVTNSGPRPTCFCPALLVTAEK
jgi:2-polyprenyl-3-methyl-5-hydroxy-6-metoxy-1,4-benzoquinol methylase